MASNEPIHPQLPGTAVPMRRDGYHLGRIPCCEVLQDEKNQNVLVLNETGALIWRLCDGDRNVAAMIQMIGDSFAEPLESVARDVNRALDTFRVYDLMDISGV